MQRFQRVPDLFLFRFVLAYNTLLLSMGHTQYYKSHRSTLVRFNSFSPFAVQKKNRVEPKVPILKLSITHRSHSSIPKETTTVKQFDSPEHLLLLLRSV